MVNQVLDEIGINLQMQLADAPNMELTAQPQRQAVAEVSTGATSDWRDVIDPPSSSPPCTRALSHICVHEDQPQCQ